jgi:hypothetical protein
MLTTAALCPAPPLLARELTGADPVLPELRQACSQAVDALLQAGPDVVIVVGVGGADRTFDPVARLDVAAYAPVLATDRTDELPTAVSPPALPLSIGLGNRLLDEAGYQGRRELHSVGEATPATGCAALGARLAAAAPRVALLVMADGSARRSLRAPGYLDARAEPFDAKVSSAIRTGDMAALLALDEALAAQLLATGRPAWQVLAGAMTGSTPSCVVRYDDDPFGVAYLVASLAVA